MELHQARYFPALRGETTSTRAAEHCGVSQPSSSK
jgi:DNA-binding transcriptional LysR family regulator